MIEVKHLTKNYGRHTAVSDLSFTVEKGQIYGFLGPNGAGKSTTMSIMAGCLAATSGQVKIDGHDIYEEAREAKKLSATASSRRGPDRTPGRTCGLSRARRARRSLAQLKGSCHHAIQD
jgi:ABC-type Na+ transport system ATPase subunit NatA